MNRVRPSNRLFYALGLSFFAAAVALRPNFCLADTGNPPPPTISFTNGANITNTTQQVAIGQQISLTGSVISGQTQLWNITCTKCNVSGSEPIGGWTNYGNFSLVTQPNFSNPSIVFYFTSTGTYQVDYFIQVSATGGYLATSTFDVEGPSSLSVNVELSKLEVLCYSTSDSDPNEKPDCKKYPPSLSFGSHVPGSKPGILFELKKVKLPSTDGFFEWAQILLEDEVLINSGAIDVCYAYNGDLDGGFPYSDVLTTVSTSDSPSTRLNIQEMLVERTFAANMYLLWYPNIYNSIPISLGSVYWGFDGTVTLKKATTDTWSVVGNGLVGYHTAFMPYMSAAPTWTRVSDATEVPCL